MSDRDLHLDFVKGILVIVMVIYHTMNYFSTASPEDFEYIRFVAGSFIFISGYIVSTIYEKKYQLDKHKVAKRLIVRGLKLFTIFTVLNLVINLLGLTHYRKPHFNLEQYLNNLSIIYISGNGRLAAFQILLPISYLLIVAPAYFIFYRFRKSMIAATLIAALFYTLMKIDSYNLSLLLIGFVGLSFGTQINMDHFYRINSKLILLLLLFLLFNIMGYLSRNILTYSIGILIILKLIYDFSKTLSLKKQTYQIIILLGQYSLVSYIMQIIFLHGLSKLLLKQRWGLGYETISIFMLTNMFLIVLCIIVRFIRDRNKMLDKSYRLIFS
jgi:fucose 4-O-acetylase-like acetyltransferase